MPAIRPISKSRNLQLVNSGRFAGWACSGCSWNWPAHEGSSSVESIESGMIRHLFTTHACEDFPIRNWSPVQKVHKRLLGWATAIGTEVWVAALIAAASMIWTAQAVTDNFAGLARIGLLPTGPAEICAIGTLVWIHAKWRRLMSTRLAGQAVALESPLLAR